MVSPYHFGVIRKSVKKTDKHDARALSYYLSKGMLPEAHSKSIKKREISSLIGLRKKLVETRSKLILKVHSLFVKKGKKVSRNKFTTMTSFRRLTSEIKWSELEKYELEVIEKQLELLFLQIIKLDTKIEEESKSLQGYNNLISIKGMGSLTAGLILSNIPNINDFRSAAKLASYFGLAPRVSQSNQTCYIGKISKLGNKDVRTALVQCALICKKYSSYMNEFYERIKRRRGAAKAVVALAKKLLTTIFYTLKHDIVYEDFTKFTIESSAR